MRDLDKPEGSQGSHNEKTAYLAAMTRASVDAEFLGRIPLWMADMDLLREMAEIPGNYVEIGTAFGASACIISRFKTNGTVHCIDPLDRYYGSKGNKDKLSDMRPSPEILKRNLKTFGNPDIVRIHLQEHPPWPDEIEQLVFSVALIDGEHTVYSVWDDWLGVTAHGAEYVIFHDTHKRGVQNSYQRAMLTNGWTVFRDLKHIGVLKRV